MMLAIVTMFVVTAMALMVFIVVNPRAFPILIGQRWHMPGIGTVVIMKVLGPGLSFEKTDRSLNVMYKLPDMSYGFCKKSDLRNFGKLLPHNRNESSVKQKEIDRVLREMDRQKEKFKTYTPPGSEIQDAEIVTDHYSNRAINQYRRIMSYTRRTKK